MVRQNQPIDPYAAPHAPKDKSGPVLRIAIIALLLVGAGAGWSIYSSNSESQGLVPAETQDEALAPASRQLAAATPPALLPPAVTELDRAAPAQDDAASPATEIEPAT